MYVILVHKSKYSTPDLSYKTKEFYGRIAGCFCSLDQADKFKSFEATRPIVKKLRDEINQYFFYAIEIKE